MASYTNSLRFTLPVTGTDDGTWGDTVNNGITTLVDTSIAGTAAITMIAADYTLTSNSGATDEARSMFITLGGTPGAARNVICPAKSKLYFVQNNTAFTQTFKTLAGTGITIPNSGAVTALYCDGTNVVDAITRLSSLTLGSALPVTSGGTGAASLAAAAITTYAGAETLTNKRITQRVNSAASIASPWAWNSDSYDTQEFTALANALTISADAGTPTDGQKTVFRFQDNGTARALTWTTGTAKSFRAMGATLPTTTVVSKTMYIGCIYNLADTRWDAVAVAQEA
jgi:hypothetical protein